MLKLQIEEQSLRVRIGEDELKRLLGSESLVLQGRFGPAFALRVRVSLGADTEATLSGSTDAWDIVLPRADVLAHAERLPTRDGLHYRLGANEHAFDLLFDVDVRDSTRQRRSRD